MSLTRITLFLFFISIFMIGGIAHAELKYQQDFTQTNWRSQESLEKDVETFCKAAEGDPDIKVVNIKYTQKKEKKGLTCYSVTITCHVSKIDEDLMRINGKVFQQKHGLIAQDAQAEK